MKIIIILLLSIKVAYLFELNFTTNHIDKGLMSNGKKYDAQKYPYAKNSLSTFKNEFLKRMYALTAPHWLNEVNKNNIKVSY